MDLYSKPEDFLNIERLLAIPANPFHYDYEYGTKTTELEKKHGWSDCPGCEIPCHAPLFHCSEEYANELGCVLVLMVENELLVIDFMRNMNS